MRGTSSCSGKLRHQDPYRGFAPEPYWGLTTWALALPNENFWAVTGWGEALTEPMCTKTCVMVAVPDTIACAKIGTGNFGGYDHTEGRTFGFPSGSCNIGLTTVQCPVCDYYYGTVVVVVVV